MALIDQIQSKSIHHYSHRIRVDSPLLLILIKNYMISCYFVSTQSYLRQTISSYRFISEIQVLKGYEKDVLISESSNTILNYYSNQRQITSQIQFKIV